jgi:ribosomal protein S18 acetylase RimI-like enzyme
MSDLQIIEKNPTAEEYNYIRKQVGWTGYELNEINIGLKATLYCVCIYKHNQIIAMGRVIGDGILVFYIQDIIVHPDYQRQGIGTKIMDKVMEYIRKNSVNNTIIGLMSAAGKEEFYMKYGFMKRPNEKMGCGMTQFNLINDLGANL